jgi:hypothetical protein
MNLRSLVIAGASAVTLLLTGLASAAPASAAHVQSWRSSARVCYPRARDGNCYEPGEFCPRADLGHSGVAGDGAHIKCERYGRGDYPHWKRISVSSPPPRKTLLSLSGSGIRNSAPFLVPANVTDLTVDYSYNCSAFGSPGNFIADLLNGNQSKLGSDDQSIANLIGAGGSSSTTIYPQNPGRDYYLSVISECNWSVTVFQPVR